MSALPAFSEFFRAVHRGREPFPWQQRLAERVVDTGWPDTIGVPTGLGKTASVDIAVWALAHQADRPAAARNAATRTWYVVDRRLLVDAAHDHGVFLSIVLGRPDRLRETWADATAKDIDTIDSVARALTRLARLGTAASPLHIVRLRGGASLGQRSPDPSQPTLVFATVAMYASRLLFRGYGSSRLMRPVDAALAGIDALVLLDEAHIARPLASLMNALRQCDAGQPANVLPGLRARPHVVALTATGDEAGDRFDLDATDMEHAVVHRRISAAKPTTLMPTKEKDLATRLADAASNLSRQTPEGAGVVFCNTAGIARAVVAQLRRAFGDATRGTPPDVVLLTGQMRARESEATVRRLLDPRNGAPAGRDRAVIRERGLVVVATQTLEVGADLDFDFLVTESAGARALIQRFGRLNRLGELDAGQAVICHVEDRSSAPVYGTEPDEVWRRLLQISPLDLGPRRAPTALEPRSGEPPPRAGEMLPAHLWELAKTTLSEPDEPQPHLFFEGFDDYDYPTVSVAWRAWRPGSADAARVLRPRLRAVETVDVPIGEFRRFCEASGLTELAVLADDGVTLGIVGTRDVRPGTVVVLDIHDGGYDAGGWSPDATDRVLDVGLLGARAVPLVREALSALLDKSANLGELAQLIGRVVELAEGADDAQEFTVDTEPLKRALVEALQSQPRHLWLRQDEWASFCDSILSGRVALPDDGALVLERDLPDAAPTSVELRSDAFDGLTFEVASVALDDHLHAVAEAARGVAAAIGMSDGITKAIELAARCHDLGKADPRFQLLLDPEGESKHPLAKSIRRAPEFAAASARSWPQGGRHEALSARLVHRWLQQNHSEGVDDDLVLHLVLSHHGHGRPLVLPAGAPNGASISVPFDGTTVRASADLSQVDWSQPARFRSLCQRYGYWGLAIMEAVVRQSDHASSAATASQRMEVP